VLVSSKVDRVLVRNVWDDACIQVPRGRVNLAVVRLGVHLCHFIVIGTLVLVPTVQVPLDYRELFVDGLRVLRD